MAAATHLVTVLLGAAAALAGLAGLLGTGGSVRLPWLVPLGGLALTLDPLGAVFLAVVGVAAVAVAVYAHGHARDQRRGLVALPAFVASMALVAVAANALTFLVAWEAMALASYVLVLRDRERREVVRAGWVYAVMTHAGLACLVAAMLLLGTATGSLAFADWRAAAPGLAPGLRGLVFVLLALGFAGKAGVIPLHVWLPLAHPAAPSHVSALMSGVMVKLGVYGLLRASLDWLGPAPTWWGVLVVLAGAVSALAGILYAVVERDLKRLLAFSTIENVGIVLIALGTGLLFRAAGLPALALLGVAAALYHAVNHAAFKTLLFLGAGAVLHGTGTRNMNALGGLVHRMPWTAGAFLLGSVAIAALPPLNGFVSEWLTFQALLQGVQIPRPEVNLVLAAGLAALALTGGLAVATFVKAFGITFLALPRSPAAAGAHEAPPAMRAGMGLLAAACVGLGLGPTVVLPALAGVAAPLVGARAPATAEDWLTLSVSGEFASLSMVAVAAALALALALPLGALLLLGVARRRRVGETWGCGRLVQTARMEYTATAFANPFTRVFDFFYRPTRRLDIEVHPESRFFVQRIEYANPTRSVFDDWLYRPVLHAVRVGARRVRAIQSGSAGLYLVYILVALLLMLVLA